MTVATQEQPPVAKQPKLNYVSEIPNTLGVSYLCPNEDIGIWRELIKGKRINRAAAICSGGEVGFFSLLPTVREELVLIDHNRGSLQYAILKYLMLQKWGYAGTLRRLKDPTTAGAAVKEVSKDLPPDIYAARDDLAYSDRIGDRLIRRDPYDDNRLGTAVTQHWERLGKYEKAAVRKLGIVRFIHGDFEKLEAHGPFDLLYMSNAHDGGNGNQGRKDLDIVGRCLHEGSYILSSTHLRNDGPRTRRTWSYTERCYVTETLPPNQYGSQCPKNWELVKQIHRRDVGMSRWNYCLYQVKS
jgi:hypothetical protein